MICVPSIDCNSFPFIFTNDDASLDPGEPGRLEAERAYRRGYLRGALLAVGDTAELDSSAWYRDELEEKRHAARQVVCEALANGAEVTPAMHYEQASTRAEYQGYAMLLDDLAGMEARGWYAEEQPKIAATANQWLASVRLWCEEAIGENDMYYACPPDWRYPEKMQKVNPACPYAKKRAAEQALLECKSDIFGNHATRITQLKTMVAQYSHEAEMMEEASEEPKKSILTSAITFLDAYEQRIQNRELPQLLKLPTPFQGLEVGSGLIAVVGSPPGTGKTALVQQVMNDALANDPKLRAVVANCEMDFDALTRRELTRMTRIDSQKIRFGNLDDDERAQIGSAIDQLRERFKQVSVMQDCTLLNLMTMVNEPPGLLVVDYLQQFAPSEADAKTGVTMVMKTLRRLAKTGWSVLAVAATKRDANGTHKKESLGLSSFRESSEIEYNANSCYVLRNNGPIDEARPHVWSITLSHCKCRDGALQDRELIFHAERMTFESGEPEQEFYSGANEEASF